MRNEMLPIVVVFFLLNALYWFRKYLKTFACINHTLSFYRKFTCHFWKQNRTLNYFTQTVILLLCIKYRSIKIRDNTNGNRTPHIFPSTELSVTLCASISATQFVIRCELCANPSIHTVNFVCAEFSVATSYHQFIILKWKVIKKKFSKKKNNHFHIRLLYYFTDTYNLFAP